MNHVKFNVWIKIQFPNFHFTVASTFPAQNEKEDSEKDS